MLSSLSRSLALLTGAALALSACDGGTGPGGDNQVLLQRGSVGSTASVTGALLGPELASQLPLGAVQSIQVTVTGVRVLPAARNPDDDAAWVALSVPSGGTVQVDLLQLPTTGGVTIAAGDLDETATFSGLRIFFEEPARITLDETVTVGARTLQPGTYDLFIPSGAQTGIKVLSGFTVSRSGENVAVVFDSDASVQSITATGQGRLIMAPVLGVRDED